ncbi:MAG: HmuY family protein [Myxococcota bacterium]
MQWQAKKQVLVAFAFTALVGCGDDDAGSGMTHEDMFPSDMQAPVDMNATDRPPRDVPCQDESIGALNLLETVATGAITEQAPAPDFEHLVDARAGGFMPSESYLYARFTDAGLVKVDFDDESALESTEWDISFRRFVIRLNSGVAGPSYVVAARTAGGSTFDEVASVPEGLTFREEAYMSASCEFVSDGSGIGAPATALSSFWTYPGCVAMTGNVFVVQLATGRHVKLEVLGYYSPEAQAQCDETGSITTAERGSGNLRLRWAFLD